MRVLHITNILDTGAVDTWLVRVCERIALTHPDWQWTFYCIDGRPGRLDGRAASFGGRVVHAPHRLGSRWEFLSSLRSFLKNNPHDILHAHHDLLSAVYLAASAGLPFKKRIVHIHNSAEAVPSSSRMKRLLLREPMRWTCLLMADHLVGVSRHALKVFLGTSHEQPRRDRVLYCGIETQPFKVEQHLVELRQGMNVAPDTKLLLFVGRMVPSKNPLFLLDMLEALKSHPGNYVGCYVGSGEMERAVKERARAMGLEDKVRLLGWRSDVQQLMRASDMLVFPAVEEPKEGLGLVLVEAQAAGLRILLSKGAPDDAIVIPELAEVLPLAAGPGEWASRAVARFSEATKVNPTECLRRIESSRFSLEASAQALVQLYN